MAIHTYDEFLKAVGESGLNFSDHDLALAKANPDTGFGILQQKQNWNSATTPEAKQAANDAANALRLNAGNYTGGADGSQYNLNTEASPSNFNYGTYESPYDSQITDALSKLLGAGAYTSKYGNQIDNVLSGNYNVESNPIYQQYAKANNAAAKTAANSALGAGATLTGGMLNSAALAASQQAANTETAKTSAAIPGILSDYLNQLQTQDTIDYQKWIDGIGIGRDNISTLQSLDTDKRNQYNTQKQAEYQQLVDALNYKAGRIDAANELTLNQANQALNEKQIDMSALVELAAQGNKPAIQQVMNRLKK